MNDFALMLSDQIQSLSSRSTGFEKEEVGMSAMRRAYSQQQRGIPTNLSNNQLLKNLEWNDFFWKMTPPMQKVKAPSLMFKPFLPHSGLRISAAELRLCSLVCSLESWKPFPLAEVQMGCS